MADGIEVRSAGVKGRGVFAIRDFAVGEVIERCPVVIISASDVQGRAKFEEYLFHWFAAQWAMVCGFGMLYNHSREPNAEFVRFPSAHVMHIVAVEDIPANREITIDYGWPEDTMRAFIPALAEAHG